MVKASFAHNARRSWAFTETRNPEIIDMDAAGYFRSEDFLVVILCAFRYALGRQSFCVSTMVGILTAQWDKLGHYQEMIKSEIREAIDRDNAGMEMDIKQWERILDL